MGGTCWGYDASAPPEVRKLLKRDVKVGDNDCLLADCGGKHCSPHGEDVCHYSSDGKKKRAAGKPRLGLRRGPRPTKGLRRRRTGRPRHRG